MKIPCDKIAISLKKDLASRVKKLKKQKITPRLVTFLIGESSQQQSFVAIKKKVAKELGVAFEFIHIKKEPPFMEFASIVRERSHDPATTGVIIQQPLPARLQTDTVYNFVPAEKEIEGHRSKSPHLPPLGLAVLSALKYVFNGKKSAKDYIVDPKTDLSFFKQALKSKRVVMAGHGLTGGVPIGKTFNVLKINYINTNSHTFNPDQYYKDADVIITAVGKKILSRSNVKPGAILINVGLRREKGRLKGDYDENDIKKIAGFYTVTPGGTGPLDVLYLYKNLVDASEISKKV